MNRKRVKFYSPEIVKKIYRIKDDLSKGKDITSKIQELVELLYNLITSRGNDSRILILTFPIFNEQEKRYFILPPYIPLTRGKSSNEIINIINEAEKFAEKIKKREFLPIIELFKDILFPSVYSFCIDGVNFENLLDDIIRNINLNVTDDVKNKILKTIKYLSGLSDDILKYIRKKDKTKKRFIFIIPITLGIPPHSFVVGIIYCDPNTINDKLSEISLLAYSVFYPLHYLIKNVLFLRTSIRSAVAAIMSRNMSHNIGSHVLAKMGYASFAELNLPQSQILYKYMQQRMDFVAITSTEFPQWSYPTWFLKELMRWFYQQETLLEFIAKQEGIEGSYKWAKSKDYEENKNTLIISIRYNNNKWIIHENQAYTDPEGLKNDFLLAIPGGIIGYHAFYVILEDIIRNSAKHNWASLSHQQREEKKQLKITIDIENKEENDFVIFKIYDNISETTNEQNPLPQNYEELTPEEIEKLPLHQKMNVYLTRSFIDNTGQLKKENWGLQEMKISAGYLNKSNVEDIGKNGEEVLDILKAVAVKDPEENDKYRLGYEFKIPKPKTVAIIGKNEKIKKKFNTSEAKKYGIYYFENTPPDFDYEFMILINDGENEVLTNLLNNPEYEIEKLPYRLFVLTDREIPPQIETQIEKRVVKINNHEGVNLFNNDYEKFKIELYKKWIEKLQTKASDYSVYIDFTAPQSDKWDLELFQKCENLIKTFAKVNKKNDDEINHALGKTHTDTEVKEGDTDPVAFFFSALNFDASNVNKLEKEFKNSLPFFSITQNLPPIYENGNIQNFKVGTETDAQIKIKRHDLPTGCFYGEEISGSCTHYLILFNYQKDSQLHYQILENAVFKMLIIDERVIDFIGKKTARVKQRFSNSRIIIPNSNYTGVKITINGKTYKFNWKENAKENLWDLGDNNNDIDLLVIHQGIIDKMKCGEEKINPEEFVRKVKEKIPFVIITSGRGEPENVPKNAKFVSFSVIESTLLKDYHEKFILTQILMNLKNR
jgi:hypothetical protein